MLILMCVAIAAIILWAVVRRRYFPAPVPWTDRDEFFAEYVAHHLGVTIEEARLAVLAWHE